MNLIYSHENEYAHENGYSWSEVTADYAAGGYIKIYKNI